MNPKLIKANHILKTVFQEEEFRPLQAEIIQATLAMSDVLVVLPTGYGKSLTFQIPALVEPGFTIVISPLLALITDQVQYLNSLGVEASTVNSSIPHPQRNLILNSFKSGKGKLLYVSPEQCFTSSFKQFVTETRHILNRVVVDEAHCAVEWGSDFRKDYAKIGLNFRKLVPSIPFSAFTGTASVNMRAQIAQTLAMHCPKQFVGPNRRPYLHYEVRFVESAQDRLLDLLKFIRMYKRRVALLAPAGEYGYPGCGIIYCRSRVSTEAIASALNRETGHSAVAYHAGLSPEQREYVLNEWIKGNSKISIVVATIAFGLGIDKPDTRFVVHFDMPQNIEAYVQQTGRAGRDRKAARCILYYSSSESRRCISFAKEKNNEEATKASVALVKYAQNLICCRHIILDEYFGDRDSGNGNNNRACDYACDYCKDPGRLRERYNAWYDMNS